jgi:hypothetical protein
MSTVHICARFVPKAESVQRKIHYCPTCKSTRAMCVSIYEWYGAFVTCLNCGEQWSDGEQLDRPFEPGWRKKNIASALRTLEDSAARKRRCPKS